MRVATAGWEEKRASILGANVSLVVRWDDDEASQSLRPLLMALQTPVDMPCTAHLDPLSLVGCCLMAVSLLNTTHLHTRPTAQASTVHLAADESPEHLHEHNRDGVEPLPTWRPVRFRSVTPVTFANVPALRWPLTPSLVLEVSPRGEGVPRRRFTVSGVNFTEQVLNNK